MDVCNDNIVYVGRKFFMRYVVAVLMKFNVFRCGSVVIKARGSNISRAVLVAETSKELIKDVEYSSIDLGSVGIESGGVRRVVSTIKVVLSRAGELRKVR